MKKLIWESENFGYPCYELNENHRFDQLKAIPAELIVVKLTNPVPELDGYFYDEKIFLEKINLIEKPFNTSVQNIIGSPLTPDLLALSFEAGQDSRFKRDTKFCRGEFDLLYKKWIENSLNGEIADIVYGYVHEGRVIGLVTLRNDKTSASIGLIAVKKEHHGKGIGSILLSSCESYCLKNNIKSLKVPTQGSNKQALSFYQRNDFKVINKEHIYHWWNK